MASKNKIGIEVQVDFPSIAKLQEQITQKYDEKIKLNLKLGVTQKSISDLKKDIQTAFDTGKALEVKVDFGKSLKTLKEIKDTVDDIDKKLGKTRTFKIDFNIKDMDKTMTEILKSQKEASKELTETAKKHAKERSDAYDREVANAKANAQKMARIQETIYNEGTNRQTKRFKLVDDLGDGRTQSTTIKWGGDKDVTNATNEAKAQKDVLKEIEDQLKKVHKLRMDIKSAEGQYKQDLIDQKKVEEQILRDLNSQYDSKHRTNALNEDSVRLLIEQQKVQARLRDSAIRQQEADKQEADAKKEIQQAISKITQLESKKQQLVRQLVTAEGQEADTIKEQINYYDDIQQKLIRKHDLMQKMTAEQKEEFQNIQRIGFLQEQQVRARQQEREDQQKLAQQERERQQAQRQALNDMQGDLRRIHNLELQIAEINARQQASQNSLTQEQRTRVRVLENELSIARDIMNQTARHHSAEGNLTNEIRDQIRLQTQVFNRERDRIESNARIQGEAEKVSNRLREHERLTQEINRLQRDLIFAGMREEGVIQRRVSILNNQRNTIMQQLESERAITTEMRQQIQQAQRLQAEQNRIAESRRVARERDQSYNDTGGLVDPWSFAGNVQQGAMAIYEPIQKLDEAFIHVAKVADATTNQLEDFKDSAYDVGSSLGVSAEDYMTAVEKWVTAGKNFQESQAYARDSLIGSFVGNISPDEMVKYMAVPLEAYQKDALKTSDIINSMNEVANNNAIEMTDLGKAYVRSATTAKNAGVEFADLTGMITAAQEATRKGGERIGTGIKTIAMNVGILSAQMTPLAQKKYNWFKDTLGIDMIDPVTKDAKSLTEVLDELHDKWDGLTKEQKTNAEFYLAGKEHAETMSAIIDQWDTVEKVQQEVLGQQNVGENGSAFVEFAKQGESVKFKLQELKNAWEKLMTTIGGSSSGVGNVLGALTDGLEEVNKLANNDQLMTTLKYIFAGVAIHAGANLYKRFFDTVTTGFKSLGKNAREAWVLMRRVTGGANDITHIQSRPPVPIPAPIIRNGRTTNRREIVNAHQQNRQIDEENRRIREAGSAGENRIRSTTKLLGKLAGFIPILGDALLLLDLAGVDVFGSMGKMIGNATTSAKELGDEIDKTTKKALAQNQILNGSTTRNDKSMDDLTSTFQKGVKDDGYLNQDEFGAFKDKYNKLAESVGLKDENGIAIQVTMNDTSDIMEKLAKLREYLLEIKKNELQDLGGEVNKKVSSIDTARDKWSEDLGFLKQYKDQLNGYQDTVDKLQAKMDKGVVLTPQELDSLNLAQEMIKKLKRNISETKEDIEVQKSLIEKATGSVDAYTQKIITYVNQGGTLAGMDKDALRVSLGQMSKQYNDLTDDIRLADGANKQLTETNQIQLGTWQKMQQAYPQLAGISADEVNNKESVRKKVLAVIKAEQDKKKTQADTTKKAIDASAEEVGAKLRISEATGHVITATRKAGREMDDLSKKVNDAPDAKPISIWLNIKKGFWSVWNKIFGQKDKHISVGVSGSKSDSVSTIGSNGAVTSNSVSSDASSALSGNLVKNPTTIASINNATSTSTDTTPPAKVSEDVWRYWGQEEYGMKPLEDGLNSINRLLTDISKNTEKSVVDYDKMLYLYDQQQMLLRKQISQYKSLQGAKNSEIDSVLSQLLKYGFGVNYSSNTVSNLDHAKSLSGDSASKAEELLNKWKSLYEEIDNIDNTIANIGQQISDIDDSVKQTKISKEFDSWQTYLKGTDALLTSISNKDDIYSRQIGFISDSDKELALLTNESAMNSAKSNISSLITQFNKLSQANIGYKENGTQLKTTLDNLGKEILSQADNVIKYQQAINDLEFSRVIDDLDKFSNAVDENQSRIDNNVKNLEEGLLSGTSINDLISSKSNNLELSRNNQYEQFAIDRVNLEKEVQDAMDGFAKKNIDRETGVANSTLAIQSNMYNQMLKMQSDYTAKRKASYSEIVAEFDDLTSIGLADENYKLANNLDDSFDELKAKQDALTKQYGDAMTKALSPQEQEDLTNKYIVNSLKMQEDYYKASIEANKQAMTNLQNQLSDASLTDDQEDKIKQQINSLEKENIDSQNKIKSAIKDRFDFEFNLLDESLKQYDKYSSELQYSMDILKTLGGQHFDAQGIIMESMLSTEKARNAEVSKTLTSLEQQLDMYEKGSYEWNIINEEVEKYHKLLQDSNIQLLDMNKNILSNSFDNTMSKVEKGLFDGKTSDQFKEYHDLWITGLEREIALEDMYKRLKDLQTTAYDEKMKLLDRQEKISRFEMDYLNTQLDILEAQKKLDNLNKEKTVQALKENADGTWDWVYQADATEIENAQQELHDAQMKLQQQELQAREDYSDKLSKILDNAENGQYSTIDEFKKAIDDLTNAYSVIVGDFPEIKDEYLNSLIDAYAKYIDENGDILSGITPTVTSNQQQILDGLGVEIVDAFKSISKDIGESFANTLIAKLPSIGIGTPATSTDSKSISINLEKLEFPNVTSADGLKEAILNLPSIALQKSKEKL